MVDTSNSGYNIIAIVAETVKTLQRKSQNVVVSGLVEKNLFVNICKNFLKLTPAVTTCMRLGQLGPLVSDKNYSHINVQRPRLLLVTLSSETEATAVLHSARLLRSVTDQVVCKQVFINKDLTQKTRIKRRSRSDQLDVIILRPMLTIMKIT